MFYCVGLGPPDDDLRHCGATKSAQDNSAQHNRHRSESVQVRICPGQNRPGSKSAQKKMN